VGDKASAQYREVTRTLRMNPDDMKRLGLADGSRVRLRTAEAEVEVTCVSGRDELPPGLLFIAYGPESSRLLGGDTQGTGMPAPTGEAVDEAARLLRTARYPVVYGLSDTTAEAQRVAVEIADRLGACLDTTTSVCHGPSGIAFQAVGEATCTLGEIKNRADLVIFWGGNPAESHPRHFTKFSVTPKGMFVPRGRKDRYVVVVDVRRTPSARPADPLIPV